MDPITITILSALGVTGGVAALEMWRIKRRLRLDPPQDPPEASPEPPDPPEPPEEPDPPEPPEPPDPPNNDADHGQNSPQISPFEVHLSEIIERILANIPFTSKRVFVGMKKVSERSLGFQKTEVPYPADDIDVRPMHSLAEVGQLLPSELLADDYQFLGRLASQEAMVTVHVEDRELFEDVHEEEWKDSRRFLYLLVDVSPSMFPHFSPWKIKIWKPLIVRLLSYTLENEAVFMGRKFWNGVSRQFRAVTPAQEESLREDFMNISSGSGTNISRAISAAINDFATEDYDEADIVIVTDGEDEDFNAQLMRAKLDEANIRLHSRLIGVENQGLRDCSDTVQIIEPDGRSRFKLSRLVKRS